MQHILANEPLDFITFIGRKKELMITLYTSLWYNLSKESKNLGYMYTYAILIGASTLFLRHILRKKYFQVKKFVSKKLFKQSLFKRFYLSTVKYFQISYLKKQVKSCPEFLASPECQTFWPELELELPDRPDVVDRRILRKISQLCSELLQKNPFFFLGKILG